MHDENPLCAQHISDAGMEMYRCNQARDQLLAYLLHLAKAADDYLARQSELAVPTELMGRGDALALLDAERANLTAAVQMAVDTGRDKMAVILPLLLARYLVSRRQFNDLLETTAISLKAARRLGDRPHEGDALINIGAALQQMCRFEEAIVAYQEAVAIFREIRDQGAEGDALTNLGHALKSMRRFDEAIVAHEDAVAVYREIADRRGQGDALTNLGLALKSMRRFDEAIVAHEDAVAVYREIADRNAEGDALNNLGIVLWELGQLDQAISVLQDAAAIFEETSDTYGRGIALDNLGSALEEVGRFNEAIVGYREAAIIFRESGDQDREDTALKSLERVKIGQLFIRQYATCRTVNTSLVLLSPQFNGATVMSCSRSPEG